MTQAIARAADPTVDLAATTPAAKPRLRGWIHAVALPLSLASCIVLIVLAPPVVPKLACAVYGISTAMLFGVSATYHLGTWSPRATTLLRRFDHANIFLIIAGTHTPLAVLGLPRRTGAILLAIVWGAAVLGLAVHVTWITAPRWLYTSAYVAIGCTAVAFIPQFWEHDGPAVVVLIAAGGVAYIAGAVFYALKRPNIAPRWFGFHELFHSLTVIGYACHAVAIYLALAAFS